MKKGKVVWSLNIIIISIKNKNVDRYLLKHIDKWGKDINPMFENVYINKNTLRNRSFPIIHTLCKRNIDRNFFILDSSNKLNIEKYQKNLLNDCKYYLIYSPTEEKSTLSEIDVSIFEAIGKITYNNDLFNNLFCSKKNHFWEMAGNKI